MARGKRRGGTLKPRKSRAKYSTRFRNAIKKIRSALATLKRKKIIPKTTEVRKALPTSATRKLVARHKAVVKGEATTYRLPTDIPPQVIRDLRKLGYKTTGKGSERRLIVPKTQYVRKGKIYERPTKSRKGFRIVREGINLEQLERQVQGAFRNLKPGESVGFEVGGEGGTGGRSYNLYGSPDSMLRDLMAYQERGFRFTHLVTFKVTQAKLPAYAQDASRRARERVIGSPQARARQNERSRERAARQRGLRTSRGH